MAAPALYRGMDRAALDAAYNNSAAVADSQAWVARWRARSAEIRAEPNALLDVPYGARPRAKLDYFPCGRARAPLFAFIHGGYWQRNDKDGFAFVADGPRPHGSTWRSSATRSARRRGSPTSSGKCAPR